MSEKPFDPAIVGTLSRHAAAGGIERVVLRQDDFALEMTLAVPAGGVSETRIPFVADCAGILHWRHPDCPDVEAGGAAILKAGEVFAWLEAGGVILSQTAPAAGRGERRAEAGALVGYGTLLMELQTP
ncbi:MAG TPA: hypothetical protein VGN93_00605 [Shinella sp.]|uniref:hypothetical protein n=1 Tax=Shinella sp. TaxID=1870904 RepID=UPI0029A9F5BF|nr:hypothetical protein [Shinella sp.]MDX3978468.1 hypothetical protein [Shinella sp.]HEV7245472.1 hypothetical protein [Shinella sp.]